MDEPIINARVRFSLINLRSSSYRNWLFGLVLIAVIALAYQPTWNGKPIWDDQIHITVPELRSLHGLVRIWTDPAAAPQYYPVLHTIFWFEHKLWSDWPLPYHLVNILLHGIGALLLLKILRQLEVPGGWVAAAVFALHPVQVESVAWISELKNTLSTALCFGSAVAYLKYDQHRKRSMYLLAFALFFIGLLTKTAIVTLPAVLLVVFWWKRGRLTWSQDARPLIPFFLVAFAAGIVTVWVEQKFCAEHGEIFEFSMIERFLVAGRLFWFYLGKLFWPANLIIIYPRWNVSETVWWQYLFPITAMAFLVGLWIVRRRSRAPFAAVLCFLLILFPVLGFFNLSYFMSTPAPFHHAAIFRADHFQYLANIPIITAVSAGAALLLVRMRGWWRRSLIYAACLAILVLLASLTYAQSRLYRDAETCFRAVIAKNPDSATAHNNLGSALFQRGSLDEAIAHFEKAAEIEPDYEIGHYSLGAALLEKGRVDEAIPHLEKVLKLNPNHPKAYYGLATALLAKGQTDKAAVYYERAVKLNPSFADAHGSLGNVLLQKGEIDAAIAQYQQTIQLEPRNVTAHYNLAVAFVRKGQLEEAIAELRTVLRIQPDYPDAEALLRDALARKTQP